VAPNKPVAACYYYHQVYNTPRMRKHKWLLVTLFLAVLLAYFRYSHGIVQQDNYIGYARMLPGLVGQISFFDSRLFPGLPILIYIFTFFVRNFYLAGYIITLLSFIGSYFLLYKITNSKLSFLPLIFPPILLNLASLIDTEFPFIFLLILGYFFIKKEKFAWAFIIIGLSVWFRLAGVAVMFGVFIYSLIEKDIKKFFTYLPYFLIPVLLLVIYNVHFFGSVNPFYQLFTYENLHPGRISIGLVQLGQDIIRAYRWGWFRILLSGFAYVLLFAVLWLKSIKTKSVGFWMITGIYIFTLMVNLVPFLENIGRYLAPTIPLFWLFFYKKFTAEKWVYFLLPVSLFVVLL
jgi:hypothetical protein